MVRAGPFRPYTEPDARAFMRDLQDGYFPYELKFAFPEGGERSSLPLLNAPDY